MKLLAYFTFTLLSVVIQFAVMEYNQERMQLQLEDKSTFTNLTRIKRDNKDNVKITQQAFYFRTPARLIDVNSLPEENKTSTISTKMDKTTADPFSSTLFDILLEDEDVTDISMTSEYPLTSTEYENVSEFSIFTVNNSTTTSKPDIIPIKPDSINCQCDLLYNICDVNCCCDVDCSQQQMGLFQCSIKEKTANNKFLCSSIPLDGHSGGINDLFCIAKTNLPEKRNKAHYTYNTQSIKKQLQQSFKWRHYAREDNKIEFTQKPYSSGNPIWLLRNGTVAYLDVPSASLNSFCGRRKAVTFLKNEEIKCSVDIKLLEMFNVLHQIEETVVISVPPGNISSTVMNCSSLHCTKWEILVCNHSTCIKYNKSLHDPVCTGDVCTNLALNLEYVFYYHNFTITNATIHLHVENATQETFTQHVSIKFYITDKNVEENVIQLSGNPGYVNNLPVIISTAKQNHTEYFFNRTSKSQHVYIYPKNVKGSCVKDKHSHNKLKFNENKRTKCLFNMLVNKTNACESIQSALQQYMGLDKNIWISPVGNPRAVTDDEWISMKMPELLPVGQMVKGTSVYCENLISTLSLSFGFAEIGDEDSKVSKIFTGDVSVVTRNVTFELDNVSVLLTFESIFIDVTKLPDYQFAAGPHLNIRLPNDFFFPFP